MLAEAFASGRMHHAWLLTGPRGHRQGDARLSLRPRTRWRAPEERDASGQSLDVADDDERGAPGAGAVASGPAGHPPALRPEGQALRRQHPGRRGAAASSRSWRTAPPSDGWRVVIVDQADELNVNAANALLKSLEEPPTRTVFLLVSSAPGRLLPTIRSRCRTLALSPLGEGDLRAAATQALTAAEMKAPPAAPTGRVLEPLAEGSAGRAARLLAAGGGELHARIDQAARLLAEGRLARRARALPTSCNPSPPQPRFELFFELLLASLRPPDPRRRQRRGGARRPRAGGPASSARPGLPRWPPCGKE